MRRAAVLFVAGADVDLIVEHVDGGAACPRMATGRGDAHRESFP
jgi:hypothetical protein